MKIYKSLANFITILRLCAAPFVAYSIVTISTPADALLSLVFFFLVALTDYLDGLCARFFGASAFGAFADPIADKALILCSMGALWGHAIVPLGALLIVAGRDLWITYIRSAASLQKIPFTTSRIAKYKTFAQCIGVCVSLLAIYGAVPLWFNDIFWLVVVLLTLWSGLSYSITFFKHVGLPEWFKLFDINTLIASGILSGFIPRAPGTFGTLVGWFIVAYLQQAYSLELLRVALVLVFSIGLLASYKCTLSARDTDPSWIVIDEIVGFWFVLVFLPVQTLEWQCAAFVLFRFFDISKVGLIGTVDRRFKNALGLMLDDMIAGGYTITVLWIINHMRLLCGF